MKDQIGQVRGLLNRISGYRKAVDFLETIDCVPITTRCENALYLHGVYMLMTKNSCV